MKLRLAFLICLIFEVGFSQDLKQLYRGLIDTNRVCYVIKEPKVVDFEYLRTDTLLSMEIYGLKNKIDWDSLEMHFLSSYSNSLFQSNFGKIRLISVAKAKVIRSINSTLILPEDTCDKKAKNLLKRFLRKKKDIIKSYSYPLKLAKDYCIIYQSHTEITSYSYYSLYYWNKDVKKWIEKCTFHHMKE